MSRLFYHVMQDNVGNLLFDVSGTMRIAGSGTLATIYGDEGLTVILPNPMTNHPSFGSFKCFLGAGDYDFYPAKSGYTFETLTGVQGHGSMAQQDATAVAITAGSISGIQPLQADQASFNLVGIGTGVNVSYSLVTTGAVSFGSTALITSTLGLRLPVQTNNTLRAGYQKAPGSAGIVLQTIDDDAGPGAAIAFLTVGATPVGSIVASATTTAYLTTSDGRLKTDVHPLTGALDVVRALRPLAFRWRSDDSPGVGFIAQDVAPVVPGVITGAPDAVDEEGRIVPQMIDPSKLVVWLVGAVQTLAAKVVSLETHLGI